jgi:hypothetical protein
VAGATWATRIASETLYRVIAALLVLIAVALAANHVGTISQLDLATGAQVVAGLVAGMGIGIVAAPRGSRMGARAGCSRPRSGPSGGASRAARGTQAARPGAHHLASLLYLAGGLLFRYAWVGAGRRSARHHRAVARMASDGGPGT